MENKSGKRWKRTKENLKERQMKTEEKSKNGNTKMEIMYKENKNNNGQAGERNQARRKKGKKMISFDVRRKGTKFVGGGRWEDLGPKMWTCVESPAVCDR